jgi:DNA repair protein RadA/Sms
MGKCPECNSWNSFIEEIISETIEKKTKNVENQLPVKIQEVQQLEDDIFILENESLNVFFGAGIVP